MATTGKEGTPGKEKRGTSPSNLHRPVEPAANRKRNPKLQHTHPSSLDKKQHTTTQSSDKQRVPNYLKPTISSRVDQPSLKYVVKKHGREDHDTTKKPSLSQRNSFDKPPSPSKVQKPLLSASFRERTSIHPPPPISKKPTTWKKPISERPITKRQTKTVYKVVRSQPSPVSKSTLTNPTIKKNDTTNDLNVIHEALNTEKSPEQEAEEKEESLMNDVEEELVKVESSVELFPPDISIPPKTRELVDTTTDGDDLKPHADDEKLKPCDISTVSEYKQNAQSPTEDIIKTKTHGEEIANIDHVEEDIKQRKEESENTTPIEMEVEVEENSPGVLQPQLETQIINKEGEEESTTVQRTKIEEREEVKEERVVEEAKMEAEKVKVLKRQATNKKDSPPAYNDVIEETASKLLEKRKNKVSALVGAFETVISLQEPEA